MTEDRHPITDLAQKEQDLMKDLIKNLRVLNRNFGYRRSFMHGMIVALGSTVGFAIAITGLTYILRWLASIPGMRDSIDFLLNLINRSQ